LGFKFKTTSVSDPDLCKQNFMQANYPGMSFMTTFSAGLVWVTFRCFFITWAHGKVQEQTKSENLAIGENRLKF
jgi:hypothetical protein